MDISGSAFSSGLAAVQTGQRRVDQAAGEIASAAVARPASSAAEEQVSANVADLATSLTQLQVGKVEVQAGARVIETADEVLGTLLDTRA